MKAVFKVELESYRDVVVFSSRGSRPLADKLSGGDYDGDQAWICWEAEIVTPFQKAEVPQSLKLEDYGFMKDGLKVSDLIAKEDCIDMFLYHGFDFNLQPSLLGSCTVFHEAFCYAKNGIRDPPAIAVALLLGHLVDRAKGGLIFDEKIWHSFLKQLGISGSYPRPAYKDKGMKPKKDHLIDNLMFNVAKGVREKALQKLSERFKDVSNYDNDLTRAWKQEVEAAKNDPDLSSVLHNLKTKLQKIKTYWAENTKKEANNDVMKLPGKTVVPSFLSVVERCRADFLSIQPLAIEGHPLVARWRASSSQNGSGIVRWDLLKASALYEEYYRSGTLPWYVAGVELGELKALAKGKDGYGMMTMEFLATSKLDSKMARRRQKLDAGEAGVDDDDFGSDIDVDDIGDIP